MRPIFMIFSALMLSTSAMAGETAAASGPRPGTVEAMRCLVGVRQGPAECLKMFQARARVLAGRWLSQSAERDFKRGPLVSSNYWGQASDTNNFDAVAMKVWPTTEMDIFDMKFAHEEYTFYISPPDGDGKVRALTILQSAPHQPNGAVGLPWGPG